MAESRAMQSWWEWGEWAGTAGKDPYYRVECAFCGQRGKFTVTTHLEKAEPNGQKKLNYDTAICANCGNPTLLFWTRSTMGGPPMHDARQLPFPIGGKPTPSKSWPEPVARYWVQAKDNLARKNWEMAIVAARTALQCAARHKGAAGKNLKEEIDDLARIVELPQAMKDWAHIVIRDPGNDNAHPEVGQLPASAQDARDVIGYLEFLLEYIYDLPERIRDFRERPKGRDAAVE